VDSVSVYDFYGYFKADSGRQIFQLWHNVVIHDVKDMDYLPLKTSAISLPMNLSVRRYANRLRHIRHYLRSLSNVYLYEVPPEQNELATFVHHFGVRLTEFSLYMSVGRDGGFLTELYRLKRLKRMTLHLGWVKPLRRDRSKLGRDEAYESTLSAMGPCHHIAPPDVALFDRESSLQLLQKLSVKLYNGFSLPSAFLENLLFCKCLRVLELTYFLSTYVVTLHDYKGVLMAFISHERFADAPMQLVLDFRFDAPYDEERRESVGEIVQCLNAATEGHERPYEYYYQRERIVIMRSITHMAR